MTRSEAAFRLSCDQLALMGQVYFWTFTFAEVLAIKDTRSRWNHFLTLIRRKWPKACGLRVFEMHESHGLHVHLLTNQYINVNVCRKLAKKSGWGRIHVERTDKGGMHYLAKYLSKERVRALKGWRLWAGFGKCWNWSKVSNIMVNSLEAEVTRAAMRAFKWKGNTSYHGRKIMIASLVANTVLHGWEPGLGPNRKPYEQCSPKELMMPCA